MSLAVAQAHGLEYFEFILVPHSDYDGIKTLVNSNVKYVSLVLMGNSRTYATQPLASSARMGNNAS